MPTVGGDTSNLAVGQQFAVTIDEVKRLHRSVSAARVRAYVARAYHDLEGSVRPEALPEMAARLAAIRLSRHRGLLGSVSVLPAAKTL